jgi:hypothetical protein
MTDLEFTKAGLMNINRLILWAFIKHGYDQAMSGEKIAKKIGIKQGHVYRTACRLGFSVGVTNAYCAMTPEGVQRGLRKRQQSIRNRTVPITLPGPNWARKSEA